MQEKNRSGLFSEKVSVICKKDPNGTNRYIFLNRSVTSVGQLLQSTPKPELLLRTMTVIMAIPPRMVTLANGR